MVNAKIDITLDKRYTETGSLTYLSMVSVALVFLMITIMTAV